MGLLPLSSANSPREQCRACAQECWLSAPLPPAACVRAAASLYGSPAQRGQGHPEPACRGSRSPETRQAQAGSAHVGKGHTCPKERGSQWVALTAPASPDAEWSPQGRWGGCRRELPRMQQHDAAAVGEQDSGSSPGRTQRQQALLAFHSGALHTRTSSHRHPQSRCASLHAPSPLDLTWTKQCQTH